MKFDTIIIGGGLTGLACGISLTRQGQRCVVISAGQSALHFSSGSFDLLNALPDGKPVDSPVEAVEEVVRQAPLHPYAKLGTEKFIDLAGKAKTFLESTGIAVYGDSRRNHCRMTPMGTLRPTWLTLKNYLGTEERLPWKKVAIFNAIGFLDFYTQFIADELQKSGTAATVHLFNLPALEHLRKNPSEMRSTNIARVFDKQENLDDLACILVKETEGDELVVLPAIIGLSDEKALDYLCRKTDRQIRLVPTLPPSVSGIQAQQQLRHCFQQAGGVYMLGDTVLRGEKEGERMARVYSYNHGNICFSGQNIVLATGSYFSQGLVATPEKVYEPVFGLDVDFVKDREAWYDLDLFARQSYQSFGVKTDTEFRGLCQGQAISNLYVAGAVLEGFNPVKEGCGAGVSLLSALYVAERILSK